MTKLANNRTTGFAVWSAKFGIQTLKSFRFEITFLFEINLKRF